MAELLQLPILAAPPPPLVPAASPGSTHTSSTLLPTFLPRAHDLASTALSTDLNKLNIPAIHMKLVKAEFVGCILSGMSAPSATRLPPLSEPRLTPTVLVGSPPQSNGRKARAWSDSKASSCRRHRARLRLSPSTLRSRSCPSKAQYSPSRSPSSQRPPRPQAAPPGLSHSTFTATRSRTGVQTAWARSGRQAAAQAE